jgi:hydroxyacylglutathione hydrolase
VAQTAEAGRNEFLERPGASRPRCRVVYDTPGGLRIYDIAKLKAHTQPFFRNMLPPSEDGPVHVAGTVAEGDEVAGFRVIDVPGLNALFGEADRVALVSEPVYTLDVHSGRKSGPRIPHRAFDLDVDRARGSIRKLAELDPSVVWAGHADLVTGDVAGWLQRAASAAL